MVASSCRRGAIVAAVIAVVAAAISGPWRGQPLRTREPSSWPRQRQQTDGGVAQPILFDISERWSVLVDDAALDDEVLSATWEVLQASLKQGGWEAHGLMGHVAPIAAAECARMEITDKLRLHAAAFARCAAPSTASCRYLTNGFADSALPASAAHEPQPGLVALAFLHEQWAANWAGEVAFSEDRQGRRSHPEGGGLAFLPRPGRALLFDAEATYRWNPPTRYAQQARMLKQQPARRLSFPAESGVAHLLEIVFACEQPIPPTSPPRPPPPTPLPPRLPLGHLRGGERWTPLRTGGARLAFSGSEQLLLFDRAWSEEAHARLVERSKAAIWAPRRRERSDGSSSRYHDAIPLGSFEDATAIFDELRLSSIISTSLGCDHLALGRGYWNIQSFVDMNEPHQDADEVNLAAEAVTALVYPHARWEPEWAGHTVFLTPGLDDVLFQAAPLPRRLVLFSGTIPHFARPATHAAHPFVEAHAATSAAHGADAATSSTDWARTHARVSLAFKLTCERRSEPAQRPAAPHVGSCGSRCSSEAMGEATSFLLPQR